MRISYDSSVLLWLSLLFLSFDGSALILPSLTLKVDPQDFLPMAAGLVDRLTLVGACELTLGKDAPLHSVEKLLLRCARL